VSSQTWIFENTTRQDMSGVTKKDSFGIDTGFLLQSQHFITKRHRPELVTGTC
jgi:hypothetical protein